MDAIFFPNSTNYSILQRLDHEHLAALENTVKQMEADGELGVCESKSTKEAFIKFDAFGVAATCFQATSLEGIKSKTRILARQGRALTAREMLFEGGDILQRLGVSVLADALAIHGAGYWKAGESAAPPQLAIAAE